MPGSQSAAPIPLAPALTTEVTPAIHVRDGKPFQAIINIPGCSSTDKTDYTKWTVASLSGSGITTQGKANFVAPCQLITTFIVDPSTVPGNQAILLSDEKGNVKSTVRIDIVDVLPAPIPPGLTPQVDVLWNVLDPHLTDDAFGGWVRDRYYAVEVIIGNNSGYELQIASVGFNLRNQDGSLTSVSDDLSQWHHVATNDYHIVRATPEKEQLYGPRAIALNIVEAVALVGIGTTPFLKNIRHQATYSTAVSLWSNPVTKGLGLVFPDLTVAELNRLDNLALHDNAILPNNTQTRTIVFVDRHALAAYFERSKRKPSKSDKPGNPDNPDKPKVETIYGNNDQNARRPCEGAPKPHKGPIRGTFRIDVPNLRPLCNANEPRDVKYWLGDLLMVGDVIEHKQRIFLPSGPQQPSSPKLSVSPGVVNTALKKKGAQVTFSLTGGDLSTLTALPDPSLKLVLDPIGTDKTTRTGTLTSILTNPDSLLAAGTYALTVSLQGSNQIANITVKDQQITLDTSTVTVAELAAGKPIIISAVGGGNLDPTLQISPDKILSFTADATQPAPDSLGNVIKLTGKLTMATGKTITAETPFNISDPASSNTQQLTVTLK